MTRFHMAMYVDARCSTELDPWEQRQLRALPPAPRLKKHTIPKFKFGIARPWCFWSYIFLSVLFNWN